MTQTRPFPLSPSHTRHAIILLIVYGMLVIAAAVAYILLSGDRRLPLHFIFLVIVTSVSVWGIRARYRWAWAMAALFAAWQIYSGVMTVLLYAGAISAPMPAKIVFGFVALRTLILMLLFVLLLFGSDREKTQH